MYNLSGEIVHYAVDYKFAYQSPSTLLSENFAAPFAFHFIALGLLQ